MPEGEEDPIEDTRVVLAAFDDFAPLNRAAFLSEEGRALRMAVRMECRAAFEKAPAEATRGLDRKEHRRASAVIQRLSSACAWFSRRDHWELDGKEAGDASAWAALVLLDESYRGRSGARAKSTSRRS